MSTPRCFLSPECWREADVTLSAEESHYLADVLRLAEGDPVELLDGQGRVAQARAVRVPSGGRRKKGGTNSDPSVQLRILTSVTHPMPSPRVTLFQALAKPARMDWLVEKATELGVAEILPLQTERVVVDGGQHKLERWERIAASAARQCGTPYVPRISSVCPLATALDRIAGFDLAILGSLAPGVRPFREAMAQRRGSPIQNVALLIGPEGDFAPSEISAMLEKGAVPVSFGPLVLRVETAAVFGLSALLYELSTAK